jgi:phosphoglycerate dehydrogenase-like enzyme
MRIVIPEPIPILALEHLAQIAQLGKLITYDTDPASSQELMDRIREAEVVVVKWLGFSSLKQSLFESDKLKYLIALTAGTDSLDLNLARQKKVQVLNCPNHNVQAVAEQAVALMLTLARKVKPIQENLRNNLWREDVYDYVGIELGGKTLVQVGSGKIGRKIAALAEGLDMRVQFVNSNTSTPELHRLLGRADFVVLAVPKNPSTLNLIDAKELDCLPSRSFLINVSRGGVVNEEALYQRLAQGKIAGAGLDVFAEEPLVGNLPSCIERFAALENVVITPHCAFNTREAGCRLGEELIANLQSIVRGQPQNVVNP